MFGIGKMIRSVKNFFIRRAVLAFIQQVESVGGTFRIHIMMSGVDKNDKVISSLEAEFPTTKEEILRLVNAS